MTVDKIDKGAPEGEIVCFWFDVDARLQGASFHPEQLIKLPASRG